MRGIWTALITPFKENGDLDLPAFKKLLKRQAEAKVAGVVTGGSTGESVCMTIDERYQLAQVALEELKGTGVKVFAGTGTSSTRETVAFSKWADSQGVDGVMVVCPYYNKPSQEGLFQHFSAVADVVKCDVMVYNVPGRTSVSLTPETVARLAAHPRINILKDATGGTTFLSEVIDLIGNNHNLNVLSGDDSNYIPSLSVGAHGVVSVASNLFPKEMVMIQNAYESGNFAEVTRLHQFYYPLFRDLFVESNPVPVKYALSVLGICESYVRAPLVPLAASSKDKVERSMKKCRLL